MDELTIDDKQYISSKRAAQITGYAKDYIGQLCREGYVEAKRVGRSWYVLEAGIKDHRFGGESHTLPPVEVQAPVYTLTEAPKMVAPPPHSAPVASTPHYEPIEIPSINLLRKDEDPDIASEVPKEGHQDFHQAWQTWFDTFHAGGGSVAHDQEHESDDTHLEVAAPIIAPYAPEPAQEEVPIQIRHMDMPAKLTPAPAFTLERPVPAPEVRIEDAMHHPALLPHSKHRGGALRAVFSAFCLVIILVSAALATLGSGYLDSSLISVSPANMIDGITIINK